MDRSRERLGIEQIDLYYAHLRDPGTPLAEQVDGLASLVEDGAVGMLGASNFWAWELERSRSLAGDRPTYDVVQFQHSYLRPADRPARACVARGHRRRRGRCRAELAGRRPEP